MSIYKLNFRFNLKTFSLDVFLRAIGVIAKLVVIIILEKNLTAEVFSKYILYLTVIALASNFSRFGSDNLFFRRATSMDISALFKGCYELFIFYKKTLIVKFIILVVSFFIFPVSEILIVFICIESLNLLHYYTLCIRARGRITESIFLYEVLPPFAFVVLLLIVNTGNALDAVFMQYLIYLIIFFCIILREIRFISIFFKNKQAIISNNFLEVIQKVAPFGLVNITNSFILWGDILLITLIFDSKTSAAYFLVSRIFSSVERFSVLPLYKVYNSLGNTYESQNHVSLLNLKKNIFGFIKYLSILLPGILFAFISINSLNLNFFNSLFFFSLCVQLLICVALTIFSISAIIESIAFVTGFENTALKNAIFISLLKIILALSVFFFGTNNLLFFLSISVVIVIAAKSILVSHIIKYSKLN